MSRGNEHEGRDPSTLADQRSMLMSSFGDRADPAVEGHAHVPVVRPDVRLFLVRHGQSEGNVDGAVYHVLADHTVPLSASGRDQARDAGLALGAWFQTHHPDGCPPRTLMVSTYKRARETAGHMLEACSFLRGDECECDIRESIFLAEQSFGLFEGLRRDDVEKLYPVEHSHFAKAIRFGGRFYAQPPLGESRAAVALRAAQVIRAIESDLSLKDVIIVSHGVTLRVLTMLWLGKTPEWVEKEPNPANCSIRLLQGNCDKGYIHPGARCRLKPGTPSEVLRVHSLVPDGLRRPVLTTTPVSRRSSSVQSSPTLLKRQRTLSLDAEMATCAQQAASRDDEDDTSGDEGEDAVASMQDTLEGDEDGLGGATDQLVSAQAFRELQLQVATMQSMLMQQAHVISQLQQRLDGESQ